MPVRVQSELRRILGQVWMWAVAVGLIGLAALFARWSPQLASATFSAGSGLEPEFMFQVEVSIAGAISVGAVAAATGLGVAIMALFTAAGPGNDFVDGSAELRRVNGHASTRFFSRVFAVALLGVLSGVLLAATLVLLKLISEVRGSDPISLVLGDLDARLLIAATILVFFQATWITAFAQVQSSQATQIAFPVGLVLACFLLSRLIPIPLTPDSWLGPVLELSSERSMLDFWWSIGGRVLWPWGNIVLLAMLWVAATVFGIRTDTTRRST